MSGIQLVLNRGSRFVAVALTVSVAAQFAVGQTTNYIPNELGIWHSEDSWDNGIPNAPDVNAVFPQPISETPNQGTYHISLSFLPTTIGSLTSNNDPTGARYFRTQINEGSLIFETTSGPATLNENGLEIQGGMGATNETRMRINVPVQLNSDLVVNSNHALDKNTNTEFVQLVSGSSDRTITKEGYGNLQFAETDVLGETEGFFGELIINNGGVRIINANSGNPPPNTQFSKSKGITVNHDGVKGGQFQLGNRITYFTLGLDDQGNPAEIKLNGPGKLAPAATNQNDGALRFETTSGFNTTFDSPVNLQTGSHIHVTSANNVATLAQEVRGAGELQKTGSGTLALAAANTYSGGTSVLTGGLRVTGSNANLGTGNVTVEGSANNTFLEIESGVLDAIADAATLSLAGGGTEGVADRGYAILGDGVNETIGGLILNGMVMAPGVYGSTLSSAPLENQLDEFFSGTGVVTVSSSFLAADFNNSGTVDGADFAIWAGGFGNAAGQPKSSGDATGDGSVNGADFLVWQQQFGSGSAAAPAGAPVPEPAAGLLGLLAAAWAARVRRGR